LIESKQGFARVPGWVVDVGIAAGLALLAIVVERLTEGRLANEWLVLWVGGGMFVLLRVGAVLARAGRTLGCLFAFLATWLIPCVTVLVMTTSSDVQRVIRDSLPLFLMLGGYLVAFMAITLERMRRYDLAAAAALSLPDGDGP
jgi:hypothetical protein